MHWAQRPPHHPPAEYPEHPVVQKWEGKRGVDRWNKGRLANVVALPFTARILSELKLRTKYNKKQQRQNTNKECKHRKKKEKFHSFNLHAVINIQRLLFKFKKVG